MLQRAEVINYFIKRCGYQRYLEIGVASGTTFNAVEAAYKVAVDPHFQTKPESLQGESFELSSDRFFDEHLTATFDIVFIDGLHTFEQALRDFTRAMGRVPRSGLILLDDCNPGDYLASLKDHSLCASGKRQMHAPDADWMGDVYRTILFIREYFDNVSFSYIKNTAGIVAVWFQPRAIVPWFQTVEQIARCEYAQFKHELFPRLRELTIKEIGDSIFFSVGAVLSDRT